MLFKISNEPELCPKMPAMPVMPVIPVMPVMPVIPKEAVAQKTHENTLEDARDLLKAFLSFEAEKGSFTRQSVSTT